MPLPSNLTGHLISYRDPALASSLAMVKTDVKNVFCRVSFSRTGLPFFLYLDLRYLPAVCYKWALFLKQTESCLLCSEFSTVFSEFFLCYA